MDISILYGPEVLKAKKHGKAQEHQPPAVLKGEEMWNSFFFLNFIQSLSQVHGTGE